MSDRYFYKLSGESAERAIEFARKQEDQRKALCDFLKERHGLEENEQYYMSHGRLIGIPIKGEMPKTFKKCQTAPKFMCPRESTKEGKAIAKEWNRFLISE